MYSVKDYIGENYEDLCIKAQALTCDPIDLVNHTYLRCLDKTAKNPRSYFISAMWRESKLGKFKEEYTYRSEEVAQVEKDSDISDMIQKDRIDFFLLNFDEFDRIIWRLYSDGWNMNEVSRESGVPSRTIIWTIKKIKDYLKEQM